MSDKETENDPQRAIERTGKLRSSRRASAATSTKSARSDNSKGSKQDDGPPTPESPQHRVTRKRAAETTNEPNEVEVVEVKMISPTHTRDSSGDSRDSTKSVCLCQPDPKIPRPRNAFILYRQHHQAAVAAQNPGLANPDISKIIGEQWRSQPNSVKNEWKQLAEEEKLRHQQQYPEYRYRPRRNDRRSSVTDPNGGKNPTAIRSRCAKCGGRTITTTSPDIPTALEPTMAVQTVTKQPATPVSHHFSPTHNISLTSPHARRSRVGTNGLHINAAASQLRSPEDHGSPTSPDAKRRRYNGPHHTYMLNHASGGPGTPYYIQPLYSPIASTHNRRESLPPPADLFRTSPPNTASSMGPPMRHPGWERMNLTLPPLKNPGGPSNVESRALPAVAAENAGQREKKSVEAMVMSMSFLGKLRILRKIAPPIDTGPTGSFPQTPNAKSSRGAIVAVEGLNRTAVSTLSAWLESNLSRSEDHDVKIWDGPRVPDLRKKATIDDFLAVVRDWHKISDAMMNFVRTIPSKSNITEGDPASSGASKEMGTTTPVAGTPTRNTAKEASGDQDIRPTASTKTPVVLLNNYTLQACDRFACTIPVNDAYSPLDHWQWMATLWRGIPGADITVYIKEVDLSTQSESAERNDTSPSTPVRAEAEKEKIGTVEVTDEGGVKCLLVWKEKDREVESSALRRLGFELGEWIRGFGSR